MAISLVLVGVGVSNFSATRSTAYTVRRSLMEPLLCFVRLAVRVCLLLVSLTEIDRVTPKWRRF